MVLIHSEIRTPYDFLKGDSDKNLENCVTKTASTPYDVAKIDRYRLSSRVRRIPRAKLACHQPQRGPQGNHRLRRWNSQDYDGVIKRNTLVTFIRLVPGLRVATRQSSRVSRDTRRNPTSHGDLYQPHSRRGQR